MKKPLLHEDRKCALLQWNAMWTLCKSHDDWLNIFPVEQIDKDTKVIVVGFLP